jgi:hypothetical protein
LDSRARGLAGDLGIWPCTGAPRGAPSGLWATTCRLPDTPPEPGGEVVVW